MKVKPGIRSTELWLTVFTIAGNVIAAATGSLSSSTAQNVSWSSIGLAGLYAVARSIVKLSAGGGGGA